MRNEYPILEYDFLSECVISPNANLDGSIEVSEKCVITFFGDAIELLIKEKECKFIGNLVMESFKLPLYVYSDDCGNKVTLLHGLGSGPYAAGQMEKLISLGCKSFIICGGCGVLEKNSHVGEIFIPSTAVRDEGTSYHYIKPSREIEMDVNVKHKICNYLIKNNIPYKCVKTWTTDAMYRETKNMVDLRKKEGCQVVEMECASYLAIAQYKGISLGQLLYAGDDLSGIRWESRDWKNQKDIRKLMLMLSINLCNEIHT